MAFIANKKLYELSKRGKVEFEYQPLPDTKNVEPERKDKQVELLESIHQILIALLNKQTPAPVVEAKTDAELNDNLKTIQSILKQMTQPKPEEKKGDWEFEVKRDIEGKLVKVMARRK